MAAAKTAETLSQRPAEQQRKSLYVGDLAPGVFEGDLHRAFSAAGAVLSVRVCRDRVTGESLRYGYVNFYDHYHGVASKALALLNHTYLKGKQMRVMWSQRDPFGRKSGIANLFVKNLDASITSAQLHSIFCKYGTVLSCKVAEEGNGQSKGYGYVQFELEESAIAARSSLHDSILEGKKLYVSKFVKKSNRVGAPFEGSNFSCLYVKNLAENVTEDTLQEKFTEVGKVRSVVIVKDCEGKSRGFGFVNFEHPEDARKAVDALDGFLLGSKALYVGRAQSKAERSNTPKGDAADLPHKHIENLKASNLYVKNLDVNIDDSELRRLFIAYGNIVSAKVMRNGNGASKGFGFVCFSSPEEAKNALNSLHGTRYKGKFLYVAMSQSKRDRVLELQKYFAQNPSLPSYLSNSNVIPTSIRASYYSFPLYSPPLPYLQHPTCYQQFGTNLGFHYPFTTQASQQNITSYIPLRGPNLRSTFNTRDWSNQRESVKVESSSVHSQDLSHGRADIQNLKPRKNVNRRMGAAEGVSRGSLAISRPYKEKSPGLSKKETGNCLCPVVENLQPELAAKVTQILSEMNKSDIDKLMKSPKALALQVDRALEVLKEMNSLSSADDGSTLLKSARCLSFQSVA